MPNIRFDSRTVGPGDVFVAVKGDAVDGHDFIESALKRGAAAIVCQHLPEKRLAGIAWVAVEDSAKALALLACAFYGNPSKRLALVGFTGTNGKTTCATLSYRLFMDLGYKAGLISTIETRIGEKVLPSTHTTPDAVAINALLARMLAEGCTHCFMEVSSHALVQHRVTGLHFAGGVFTNITHDHLDYHKTFPEYIRAKKLFFDGLTAKAFALTNNDDKRGPVMLQNCKAQKHGFSLKGAGNFNAKVLETTFEGMLLDLQGKEVWCKLTGGFNAYNLLAVCTSALLLGEDETEVLAALSRLEGASGRFEFVPNAAKIRAIVDYAHTPDALENVLKTIAQIKGNEKVITVVGCGGNRDKEKRPLMAAVAANLSDKLILTSDNPRFEEPEAIIAEMFEGVPISKRKNALCVADRKEAIKLACSLAAEGDVVLVAGKGHEPYQEVKGVKYDFDDKGQLSQMLGLMFGF